MVDASFIRRSITHFDATTIYTAGIHLDGVFKRSNQYYYCITSRYGDCKCGPFTKRVDRALTAWCEVLP